MPVNGAVLKAAISTVLDDSIGPIFSIHRFKNQQLAEQVFALEVRVLELEAQRAADLVQR